MKIYIAGPITGHFGYRETFRAAEQYLMSLGHIVINPAYLPQGLGSNDNYMHICKPMIDQCDAIYLIGPWQNSLGAQEEREYAIKQGKTILEEEKNYGRNKTICNSMAFLQCRDDNAGTVELLAQNGGKDK